MPDDGNNSQNNEQYVTEEQVKNICKDFMDEYLAEKQEEIQNAVLEACKADIERIVDEKIKEVTDPKPPANNSGEGEEGSEKSFADELKMLKDELLEEINKNKFTDEDLQKGLASYVNKERNPTPTTQPQNNDGAGEGKPSAKKTYTAEEIFKNIEANQKSSGIYSILGKEE